MSSKWVWWGQHKPKRTGYYFDKPWGGYRRSKKKVNPYKLQRDIRKLKSGQAGKEWKTHETAINTEWTSTGAVVSLTGIAQGDTSGNREGLNIHLQSIQIDGTYSNGTTGNATKGRLILFMDREVHGTYPTINDVLDSGWTIDSLPDHEKKMRFRILMDRKIIMTPQYNGQTLRRRFKYYKKFKKPKKIFYLGTAATESSQGKNNIYAIVLSEYATPNGITPAMTCRIKFTD